MTYLLKGENFTLKETPYSKIYEYEDKHVKLIINKEDFTQKEIDFANELINLYKDNLPKIALACVESDTFKYCYPKENIESIISKLGKPIVRRLGETSLLTYVEHTIDYNHILDVEFEGLYEDIFSVGIDG